MNTDALTVEIKNIKENHVNCEQRQALEHERLQEQVNDQETKLAETKKGIYNKIENVEYETSQKINKAVNEIKEMIRRDITTPLSKWKKAGIKFFLSVVGAGFVMLIGFIWWLLTVTNVINNLESLIGG